MRRGDHLVSLTIDKDSRNVYFYSLVKVDEKRIVTFSNRLSQDLFERFFNVIQSHVQKKRRDHELFLSYLFGDFTEFEERRI